MLLPVNPQPVAGAQAEEMRRWGADPALGRTLIDGLSEVFPVVAFDYEGHVLQVPKPDTLTPDNVAGDPLAVADTVGADRFAYYGYSWRGLAGLQLAIRTDRLSALAVGGFPPLDGPCAPMLQVTTATHEMAVANSASPGNARTAWQPPSESSGEPPDEPDWSQVEVAMTSCSCSTRSSAPTCTMSSTPSVSAFDLPYGRRTSSSAPIRHRRVHPPVRG